MFIITCPDPQGGGLDLPEKIKKSQVAIDFLRNTDMDPPREIGP